METIHKKEDYLQVQINDLNVQIKQKLQTGDREGAKTLLRRKKILESQLKTVQGATMNLERQQMALDNATLNAEILSTMKAGNQAIKSAMGEYDADAVADIMDDMQEQQDIMEEINQVMMGDFEAVNDEINDELDELETQMQESAFLEDGMDKVHNNPVAAPAVPQMQQQPEQIAQSQAAELETLFG